MNIAIPTNAEVEAAKAAVQNARSFVAEHGGFDSAFAVARANKKAHAAVLQTLERWAQHRKPCDSCGKSTQMGELKDITTAGDWMTVCPACAKRLKE